MELGYRVKLPGATSSYGTTRGPVSLANFACTRHRNTRWSTYRGTLNLVATKPIALGDAILVNYSTHKAMTCFGCHPRVGAGSAR